MPQTDRFRVAISGEVLAELHRLSALILDLAGRRDLDPIAKAAEVATHAEEMLALLETFAPERHGGEG